MANLNDPKLKEYRAKRDADQTPEPFGRIHIPATGKLFVVQQHHASHEHFDLRLEVDGVLKSWAVPKGPSDDPKDKRFAIETEDHPLDYADFEGEIPAGNYGAGHVIVWDRGRYTFKEDFAEGFKRGKLLFTVDGYKMQGTWTLVRLKTKDATGREWLLIKERDQHVSDDGCSFEDQSVLSGLTVTQLKKNRSNKAAINRKLNKLKQAQKAPIAKTRTVPMLATADEPHNRKGWLWELKYDGYRILAYKNHGDVRLITRNGYNLADRFPEICQVLTHLPETSFIMDGELVAHTEDGRPSFAMMQTRARSTSQSQVSKAAIEQPAKFYVFDLLHLGEHDLRSCKLTARKELLALLCPSHSALVFSEHIWQQGIATFQAAKELGVEGVVGKRADSHYQHGRSGDWIKVRNNRTQEFVIVGWSNTKNGNDIGSLALAEYRGGELCYAGHAGSGLNQRWRDDLAKKFKSAARKTSPLPAPIEKATHWLSPKWVVEVSYTEYTPKGHLRHPSLVRLRDDKKPEDCLSTFDLVSPNPAAITSEPIATVVTTNPEKIFFPEADKSKQDLVSYYRAIAPWMLPYLEQRPLVLTRYPDGIHGKSFYQRDIPDYVPDWIQRETLWSESTEKDVQYFVARTAEDLAYLANMGTIPVHMWHATTRNLDHPDWCILDLDPKQAPFSDVITLAKEIRALTEELNLPSYAKTSGASGLHVLIPLARQLTHDQSQTLGELLARVIVERHPDIATITRAVRGRGKKVYVDYLQNGHGRLIVAPYSVRAEPAASVSMPIKWSEVNGRLKNQNFHIGNAIARMKRLGDDPLKRVLTDEPDLLPALEKLAKLLT